MPKADPLSADLVKQFVIFGHGNLEGTKQMLQEHPTLLNACWDWGNGDFETALGGASHVGNRECAEWLISQGARMDIFAAAMLGKLELVKSFITTYPANAQCVGPHGISLLKHALKGGEMASPVVEYLKSLGIKE
ncbi:MAG: ankyrin repeat domain-containing protein [Saprospiraceae bacterium]